MYNINSSQAIIKTQQLIQLNCERLDANVYSNNEKIESEFFEALLQENEVGKILFSYNALDDFPIEKIEKLGLQSILTYLKLSHVYYLKKMIPEIEQSIIHVLCKEECRSIYNLVSTIYNSYKNKLVEHISYEENCLFKHVELLLKSEVHSSAFKLQDFINNHDAVEEELNIATLIINDFAKSKNSPLPFRILSNQIQLFQIELGKHGLVEDLIFVPMVLELENKLKVAQNA